MSEGFWARAGSWAALIFLGLLWFVLCRQLSNEWSVNEQYGYGWFVPFFAAYLFWLRWEDRPIPQPKELSSLLVAAAAVALLLLLPVRLFEVANPDWRPLSWLHALAVTGITLLAVWLAGGLPWLRHFAFPVCFVLVAVPWVTPIERPIVEGLMEIVAAAASETLNLFGIPAQLEGNLIRVRTGLVGVNEACSGVRSIQTSLMIGLLFGELKRLSAGRRTALVLGALGIALIGNFTRALFLVYVAATDNPAAADKWHDAAGYSIVGAVFIGSVAIASWLARHQEEPKRPDRPTSPLSLGHPALFGGALAWLLAVEIGVELWYRAHERNMVERKGWTVQWPEDAPGFRRIDIDEDVARTLRYNTGGQATWLVPAEDRSGPATTASLFFFRWEPGTSTIMRARDHRTDVCLPKAGWRQAGDYGVREYAFAEGLTLPFRHFEFVRSSAAERRVYAHSFFCMLEDKVRPEQDRVAFDLNQDLPSRWKAPDRLRVVREGLRNPGQQVMQFVLITPIAMAPHVAEARFRELLPEIVKVGETSSPGVD